MWSTWSIGLPMHSVNKEKQYLTIDFTFTQGEDQAWIHDYLIIAIALFLELFTSDFDHRIFLCAYLTSQDLVRGRDDLVEGELELSNQIVTGPSRKILEVVDVIDCNLENLFLFEFIRHIEALNPLRIEIVHYDFSHSYHRPHITFLLVEHGHSIRPCERVKIRQIFACKCEP